jgi:SNF2 family DNA or RNA helicase
MSDEQRRIYKDLKTQLLAQYEDKELTLTNKVSLTLRLMQVVGGFFPFMREQEKIVGDQHYTELVGDGKLIGDKNPKLEAIKADLEEVPDDQQVIIWAHFVPELKHIYQELRRLYPTCLYYGGTRDDERRKITEDFQQGKYKVFVGNAQTAGFGLNLQNATLQYFFSNTFRVEDRLQAEDRSHRIGVKSTVVYKDVIVKGTIDERVFANIAAGRDLNDYFKRNTLRELLKDDEEEE